MPRYIKQRDHYSCGPIAVMNARKAIGLPAPYKKLKYFKALCKTHSVPINGHRGTFITRLDVGLRKALKHHATVTYHALPTQKRLRSLLRKGPTVILYGFGGRGRYVEAGHYVTIVPVDAHRVDVINNWRNQTVRRMSLSSAVKFLGRRGKYRHQKRLSYPHAWSISAV